METADSTDHFYIDEAIGAKKGTVIESAGTKEIIRGDVNFDGKIDVSDLTLTKRYLLNGTADAAEAAADVNQSGVFNVTDIQLLQDYLVARITEFPIAEKEVDTAAMEQIFSTVRVTRQMVKIPLSSHSVSELTLV